MRRRTMPARHLAVLALACCAGTAQAGRHGVEDAEILRRGECELELTYDRLDGNTPLGQAEVSCRIGPVQLTGEAEHVREDEGSESQYAIEAKWSREVAEGWRAGVLLRGQWSAHQRPRYDATTVLGLLTWSPRENLDLHLNLGPEFLQEGGSRARWAIAPEWHVRPDLSLLAERYKIDGSHFVRGTVRWEAGHNWTLEVGRALRLAGPEPSRWTITVQIDLDDD